MQTGWDGMSLRGAVAAMLAPRAFNFDQNTISVTSKARRHNPASMRHASRGAARMQRASAHLFLLSTKTRQVESKISIWRTKPRFPLV